MSFANDALRSFTPSLPTFSKDLVSRAGVRATTRACDLTQTGGERIRLPSEGKLRLAEDVSVGVTPSGYWDMRSVFACAARNATSVVDYTTAFASVERSLQIGYSLEKTAIDGVYHAYLLRSRARYLPSVTAEEIRELQIGLRPAKDPSPAEIVQELTKTYPHLETHTEAGGTVVRRRIGAAHFREAAGMLETIANADRELAAIIAGISTDTDIGEANEVVVDASDVSRMSPGSLAVVLHRISKSNVATSDEMIRAINEALAYSIWNSTQPHDNVVAAMHFDGDVQEIKARSRLSGAQLPGWIKTLTGIDTADPVSRSQILHIIVDFRTSGTRAVMLPNPSDNTSGVDKASDRYERSFRRDLAAALRTFEASDVDGRALYPSARITAEHRTEEGRRNPNNLIAFDLSSPQRVAEAFAACVASGGPNRDVYVCGRSIAGNEEAENVAHACLAFLSADQIVAEGVNSRMLFGFTRANGIIEGLFRDPACDEINYIYAAVNIRADREATRAYAHAVEFSIAIECANALSSINFKKAGHHCSAARSRDSYDMICAAVDANLVNSDYSHEQLFNFGVYYGMKPFSTRVHIGWLTDDYISGDLSRAIGLRLSPDGPNLSGPRNVYRTLLQIESTGFFEITEQTHLIASYHSAMAVIEQVGWRMTPYASYLYGEAAPVPAGAVAKIIDAAIYAYSFSQIVPGSTISMSVAATKLAKDAASHDILVSARVEAFVKAYKNFVTGHTQQRLATKIGVNQQLMLTG